jgi:hypothetical protein
VRKTDKPVVFTNESQPQWGFGIILEDKPDRVVFLFEQGEKRIFKKPLIQGLKPTEALSPEDAEALDARLRGRRPSQSQKAPAKGAKGKKAPAPKAQTYASFEEQLRWFEKEFEGGFEGERFIAEERGREGVEGKKGFKTAAIRLAREQLAPERFKSASPEELFEAAKRVVQFTTIVHPMEGAVAFGSMKEEERAAFVAALGELLHGTGDYGARFDRFVNAVNIADADGKTKKLTWPLATILPAMYFPTEHVCVKPTYFEQQAPLAGLSANKSEAPSSAGYARFLEVARTTQKQLETAGHRPRDLMDVYSFIWRSQSYKPPKSKAVSEPVSGA